MLGCACVRARGTWGVLFCMYNVCIKYMCVYERDLPRTSAHTHTQIQQKKMVSNAKMVPTMQTEIH